VSETALWNKLNKGMGKRWFAQRHEDKFSAGIPDVSYVYGGQTGWIELKYMEKEPVCDTPNWDIRNFRPAQRVWMDQQLKYGNRRVFIICQFGSRLVLIWRWSVIRKYLQIAPFGAIKAQSELTLNSPKAEDWDLLRRLLCR